MEQITISPREYDVLIRLGKENRTIAREFGVKEQTIKSLVFSLCKKLKVHSRASIILKALKYGVVDLESFIL